METYIKERERAEIKGLGLGENKHSTENCHPSTKITELEEGIETNEENEH